MAFSDLTRTASTLARYDKIAKSLFLRAFKDSGITANDIDAPEAMALWLSERAAATHLAQSTYRTYVAALLSTFPSPQKDDFRHAMQRYRYDYLKLDTQKNARQKSLKNSYAETLMRKLQHSSSLVDRHIYLWLMAGSISGLRPSEWPGATLDLSGPSLSVLCEKTSNGRGNGPVRTLNLARLSPIEMGILQEWLLIVDNYRDTWAKFRENTARYLRRRQPGVSKKVNLYSGRHQWFADIKNHLTQEEVAAAGGHGSPRTAQMHYGRRSSGRAGARSAIHGDADLRRLQAKLARQPAPELDTGDTSL